MKLNLIIFLILLTGSLPTDAQSDPAKGNEKISAESRRIEVSMAKSSYLLGEPVPVKLNLNFRPSGCCVRIRGSVTALITSESGTTEHSQFTHNLTTVCCECLPTALPSFVTLLGAGSSPPKPPPTPEPSPDLSEDLTIFTASTLFPTLGQYLVQFRFEGTLLSNVIPIQIEEPTGLAKKAYDEIRNRKNFWAFDWIYKDKDGVTELEHFSESYGQTAYGDYVIEKLAIIYKVKGEYKKAKAEYQTLTSSKNKDIAERSKAELLEIAKNANY